MRRRGQQTVDHIKILLCHVYDSIRDKSIKKFVKIESFVDSKLNYERKKVSCVPGIAHIELQRVHDEIGLNTFT